LKNLFTINTFSIYCGCIVVILRTVIGAKVGWGDSLGFCMFGPIYSIFNNKCFTI